jgi:hypothetical protein
MREDFHIIHGDCLKVGLITREDGLFSVRLYDGFTPAQIPFDFRDEYAKGRRYFDDEYSRAWVYDRVIPPERQDMNDVLRELNLDAYDEWEVFKACSGKWCMDAFSIGSAATGL